MDALTATPFRRRARRRHGRGLARFGLCTALLGACVGASLGAAAADSDGEVSASQERVEAAYLYKFLNYAEWPPAALAQPDTPYVIGVAGDAAVTAELARIAAGRSVDDRSVIVRRVLTGDALDDLHLLFIGRGELPRRALWLRQAKGRPILTVTDDEGALEAGSIINFRTVDRRVRFDVSIDAAEQSGLRLSSRLLSVAATVVKKNR